MKLNLPGHDRIPGSNHRPGKRTNEIRGQNRQMAFLRRRWQCYTLECAHCHGPVAERDVLFTEQPTRMFSCLARYNTQ